MKKICLLLLGLCLILLPVSAAAGYVFDEYGLMDNAQVQKLEDRAQEISRSHGFDAVVHTVDNFRDFGFSDIYDYAVAAYQSGGFGENGSMLVLSMAERDYVVIFGGTLGDLAFTETGRDDLERGFLDYFRSGNYYGGFRSYLDTCDRYLTAYESGSPVGVGTDHSETGYMPYYNAEPAMSPAFKWLVSFGAGIVAAIIAGVIAAVPMRSARKKTDAAGYGNRLNLTVRRDQFLHRSVTRTPKAQNNSSGGGGGSVHHSSGSFSGRSGKF